MKKMFKNLKRSEVIIYVIAIMLVAAGYLNYTTSNKNSLIELIETSTKETANTQSQNTIIGDATLVNSDEVIKEKTEENIIDTESNIEENYELNETIETNVNQSDYFIDSKLNRDTTYASMISNYTAILEKDKVSEAEKKIAMQEITNINNIKNAIMICENILCTKGFEKNVVFINKNSINVVVKIEGGLTEDKVAQIQNILSRELEAEIQNIHITEK